MNAHDSEVESILSVLTKAALEALPTPMNASTGPRDAERVLALHLRAAFIAGQAAQKLQDRCKR